MKRFIILFLISLFLINYLPVEASSIVNRFEDNQPGFKISQYNILNHSFDNENMEIMLTNQIRFLSKLSINDLKRLNYDSQQIYAIKTYNGSIDALKDSSPYVYVSARNMVNDTYMHGVRFSWTWFGQPLFTGPSVNDGVLVSWCSYNDKNRSISTTLMYSKVKLRYGDETVFKNPEMNNLDGLTYLFFNMNGPSEVSSYAQSGYFDVAVGTNNKVSIDRTEFKFYNISVKSPLLLLMCDKEVIEV